MSDAQAATPGQAELEALAAELYAAAAAVLGQDAEYSRRAWDRLKPELPTRRRFLAMARAVQGRVDAKDAEVSAALRTVARWQGENERLIRERDSAREEAASLRAELDGLRAAAESLAGSWRTAAGNVPAHGDRRGADMARKSVYLRCADELAASIAREALEGGGDEQG